MGIAWLSLNFILGRQVECSPIFCCLYVCQASVTPDQISTFSNIWRHTSPLLTLCHLKPSSINLYWPSTSQYRHILIQYHQVPLIIHHLMSHAQYTWSSFCFFYFIGFPKSGYSSPLISVKIYVVTFKSREAVIFWLSRNSWCCK